MKKKKRKKLTDKQKQEISNRIAKSIAEGTHIKSKPSNRVKKTPYSKKTWHYSLKNNETFYCDSLAEKMRMEYLDNNYNVKKWTKHHKIVIPYIYKGKKHNCVPDFLIEFTNGMYCIEEVKGRITEKELVKKDAIKNFCDTMKYMFSFVTTKDLDINGEYTEFLKKFKNGKNRKRKS